MKKIIAAAVATAFVVPAYAADITLSGDLEYRYIFSADDGPASEYDDSDIKVTATEELANGMTVTAFVELQDATNSPGGDTELHIAIPGAGTVKMGEVDHAANQVDELGSPADTGMGAAAIAAGTDAAYNVVSWQLPEMVSGLTLIASVGVDNDTDLDSDDDENYSQSIGAKYTNGMFTLAYGQIDTDGAAYTPSYLGAQISMNGLTVGVDTASDDGAEGYDTTEVGVTYAMGDTSLYAQTQEVTTSSTVNSSAYGVLHTVGGGLKVRVESVNSDTATDDQTTVAVLYSF